MGAPKPLPTSPKREEKSMRAYYGYLRVLCVKVIRGTGGLDVLFVVFLVISESRNRGTSGDFLSY